MGALFGGVKSGMPITLPGYYVPETRAGDVTCDGLDPRYWCQEIGIGLKKL
jgi:hypothetical protein